MNVTGPQIPPSTWLGEWSGTTHRTRAAGASGAGASLPESAAVPPLSAPTAVSRAAAESAGPDPESATALSTAALESPCAEPESVGPESACPGPAWPSLDDEHAAVSTDARATAKTLLTAM
ncbi:MAG: hypothetical protein NVS3B10_00060 [Polyangiales bacterium]